MKKMSNQLGFPVRFYSTLDDSKHRNVDRHVLLTPRHHPSDSPKIDGLDFEPTFTMVTASQAATKGSDANSDLNVKALLERFCKQILVYYAGGCNDNAGDAQLEIVKTFEKIAHLLIKLRNTLESQDDQNSIQSWIVLRSWKHVEWTVGPSFLVIHFMWTI